MYDQSFDSFFVTDFWSWGQKQENGNRLSVEYLQLELKDIINYELYNNYKVIEYDINCLVHHGHENVLSPFRKTY